MKVLIIGVILCGIGLILSIGGTIELIKVRSLRNKKVFRVHYHALGDYATIVYADSPADAVRRFYDEIDPTHYYNVTKVEPVEEFE
jgi:hypothetical protein